MLCRAACLDAVVYAHVTCTTVAFSEHMPLKLIGCCFCRQARDSTSHILLTLGYGANVATSYLLMLAVMTFNVGYFITVVLGLMVGHFLLFSPALDSSSSGRLSELCCPQPS